MESFKDALRRELESAGLSQPKASEITGVSQSVLSQYLTGRRSPSLETLAKLIVAFPRLLLWSVRYLVGASGDDRG